MPLIVLSGLPGAGKSELAQQLARRLGFPVLSVDPIEAAIIRAGIPHSFETGFAAYLVAEAIAEAELKLGRGVIVDAVNAVEPAKEAWRKLAAKHQVPLKVIACKCSDEALHRRRLEARRRGLDAIPEPKWEDVQRRKLDFTPWVEPHLEVDSVVACDTNVDRVLAWLGG
jgi:predicted kinase